MFTHLKEIKRYILTIIYSIDLINETFISELCGQRGEQIHITVQKEQSVEHRQDLILSASKLPLHPQHHVGNMLRTSGEFLSQTNSSNCLLSVQSEISSSNITMFTVHFTLTRAHSPFPYICGIVPYNACKVMRPLAVW